MPQDGAADLLYKQRGEIFKDIDEQRGATKQDIRALVTNVCNFCIQAYSPTYAEISTNGIWQSIAPKFHDLAEDKVVATKYELKLIVFTFLDEIESVHQDQHASDLHARIRSEKAVLNLIQSLRSLV